MTFSFSFATLANTRVARLNRKDILTKIIYKKISQKKLLSSKIQATTREQVLSSKFQMFIKTSKASNNTLLIYYGITVMWINFHVEGERWTTTRVEWDTNSFRNDNGSGLGQVLLYPDSTRELKPVTRTQSVY